jgi:hypothetical protein
MYASLNDVEHAYEFSNDRSMRVGRAVLGIRAGQKVKRRRLCRKRFSCDADFAHAWVQRLMGIGVARRIASVATLK